MFSLQHLDASEGLRKEKDLAKYDSASTHEFKDAVSSLFEIAGKPNLADFFPIFKPFDPQGLVQKGNVYGTKLMAILERIIDERSQYTDKLNHDVLDSLLNLTLKHDAEFHRNDMRHLFFALFVAGSDTTTSTLEWAMAELIRNPQKMEKLRLEISKYMQDNNKNIQESDISQLPYLKAVIKEVLRLHPPAPFLVPHQAIRDVEVQGFIVTQNAQILCNVWAMGRDPKIWPNPEAFLPERFLDVKIDYKGQDFELIPFGAGRRICPGLNLAHRMLHIILGSLVYKFDWKLEGNMGAENMVMAEKFGLTLSRNTPLFAIPIRL